MRNTLKPTTKRTATDEQMNALRSYAAEHGRTWKAQLIEDWRSGKDDDRTDRGALLRQVRNNLGPSWLVQH